MPQKPNEIYVEQHPNGYAVLRPGAERASAVTPSGSATRTSATLTSGGNPESGQ